MTKARDLANAGTALTNVSATELGYLDGVTSAVQTQVDGKIAKTLTTTTGDIIYASSANTPARLGIGSTDQILKVSGGIPTWATTAPSGMTLIARTSFTGVSSQAFDSVFSSTYKSYIAVLENLTSSNVGEDLQLQFRYGSTTTTSTYYGSYWRVNSAATTRALGTQNQSNVLVCESTAEMQATFYFNGVGNSSQYPYFRALGYSRDFDGFFNSGGMTYTNQTYTGFLLKTESGATMTGTIAIYGLATV